MNSESVIIFTDGSSLGNPGPGGYGAVIVTADKVVEIGGREKHTTNNRMEITASIEALGRITNPELGITIYTDSQYLINGITKWVHGWKKNNWITVTKEKVLNQDIWDRLHMLAMERKIEWKKVKGHSDVLGNIRADEIATGFAEHKSVEFLHGTLEQYEKALGGSLLKISEYKSSGSKKNKTQAYSYLSLVDGKLNIDKTWAECEKRVKGVKGAKYKKSISATDEKKIIEEWKNIM